MPEQHRTYTPQEMADVAAYLDKQAVRPERVPAGDVAAQAALLGGGAMFVAGGVVWLLQMPWDYAAQICGLSFLFTTGVAVWWIMPTDKRETAGRFRRVVQTADMERAKKVLAYQAIQRLEAKNAELQQALTRAIQERDTATVEKRQAFEQAQAANNPRFVRSSNTKAYADAVEMLRYWAQSDGERWYSRAMANSQGWADKRHKAAQQLLVDSGVLVINEKRPRVMVESFDIAMRQLGEYVERVDSVSVPDTRPNTYGDEEDD